MRVGPPATCRPNRSPRSKAVLLRAFCSHLFVVVSGALLCGPVFAQAVAPHSEHPKGSENVVYLSLKEALLRGARSGPAVALAKAPLVALGDAVSSANPLFFQVPTLQAQAGPRFSNGTTGTDVAVSLQQPMSLSRVGSIQERLAKAEKRAADVELELSSMDAAERAGQAWIELALSEKMLSLRQDARRRAKENLRIVQSRVRVGETDLAALSLARSELANAKSRVLEAEGEHYLATSDLAYFTGLSEEVRAEVRTSRLTEPDLLSSPPNSPSVDSHPAIQTAEAKARVSKEEVSYAKSQQFPTISVGVQYQREGTGDQIVTGILSLPLPLWKPWRYREARSRAQHDRDEARTVFVRRQLERLVERAEHEQSHAIALYRMLKTELIPPKTEAVRIARSAFAAGEYDYLHVTWAERELIAAEEQLAAALAEVHRARLHLLRCTGQLAGQLIGDSP